MLFVAPLLHRLSFHLFPGVCRLCKSATGTTREICHLCAASLDLVQKPCARCALPVQSDEPLCGRCLSKPPAFTACVAPFVYTGTIRYLHHRFKFQRDIAAGQLLAELLAERITVPSLPDRLVPVPLHWRRQLIRGFNQAEIICQTLSTRLNLPSRRVLKRIKNSPPQQTLTARKRPANVARSFVCPQPVQDRHLALVDDICTTGATAQSAAATLLKAGAKRVDIWCVARALV